jgi:peptide-methionine (R)-S-oxide reductase
MKMKDEANGMNRRIFLVAGVAATAGLALRLHRGMMPVEAMVGTAMPKNVKIVQFSADGKKTGTVMLPMVIKTDAEWKQQLPRESYNILRHSDTEYPGTGKLLDEHSKGIFRCLACNTALFSSDTKFESGTGWPSFWQPIARENVQQKTDLSEGMDRNEIRCSLCDGHLGHVFDDGPRPTGLRYCMNSGALTFVKLA